MPAIQELQPSAQTHLLAPFSSSRPLRDRAGHRLSHSKTSLLPFMPRPVKLLLLLILLLNFPSWPFIWHIRVWYPALKAYFLVYTKGRQKYLADWKTANRKKGGISMVTKTKRIAWVDDCDYNYHLSNSSYAKSTDAARMHWCIETLSPLYTPKSHMALGASHYVFFKEIPLGTEYTMECHAGGWGDKWIYLITEFVIYPRASNKGRTAVSLSETSSAPAGPVLPSITALSIPENSSGSPSPTPGTSTPTNADEVKRNATLRSRRPRADGGVVCCLAVSEYCFKMGRVTVPPVSYCEQVIFDELTLAQRIAMFLGQQSSTPEGVERATDILQTHRDQGRAWLRGGWKEEQDADTLGEDIGLGLPGGGGLPIRAGNNGDGEWITRGREGMEKVVEGLGVF